MVYYEEYGKSNEITLVMLHGANFVHSFGRQYSLAEKFHILVPHIMGFGKEAERTFNATEAIDDIVELIRSINRKVFVIGFSLGAQLTFSLISNYAELFYGAVLVSPWLIKNEAQMEYIVQQNMEQYKNLKKPWLCNLIGMMNGLPKEPRKDFVRYMQTVNEATIYNSINNGIIFSKEPKFKYVEIPILAIAGEREADDIKSSVIKMHKENKNCQYEIWEKAAHNIPPVYFKRFNARLMQFIEDVL